MASFLGQHLFFLFVELFVGASVLTIICGGLDVRTENLKKAVLFPLLIALLAGYVAGYRFTKDVIFEGQPTLSSWEKIENDEKFKALSSEAQKEVHDVFIERVRARSQFTADHFADVHAGAAMKSLPVGVITAIMLYFMASRIKAYRGWALRREENLKTKKENGMENIKSTGFLKRNSMVIIVSFLIGAATGVLAFKLLPSPEYASYEECILDKLKGSMNTKVMWEIRGACRKLYSAHEPEG